MNRQRLIAFYLPQYHPIPENNEWWGNGFTEWTNVARAKPLYHGHVQPKIPKDLGFYDLRVPEVREKQAELARYAGIYGFCYWHYWFNGKRLLERPFDEVVKSGKPDFPFCLGWANHSWKAKNWNTTDTTGRGDKTLIEQTYGGVEDYTNHFMTMLDAFRDNRYIRANDKLLFLLWQPEDVPDLKEFKDIWNELAKKHGLPGFYFVGFCYGKGKLDLCYNQLDNYCVDYLFDAVNNKSLFRKTIRKVVRLLGIDDVFPQKWISYDDYTTFFTSAYSNEKRRIIPCVVPNYDHSPRSKKRGAILKNSTPKKFIGFLEKILNISEERDTDIIFVKAWNEWGEGNYLEPDYEFGDAYIQSLHSLLFNK